MPKELWVSAMTNISIIRKSLAVIDDKWPGVKFFSLGLYSAWILLMMSGSAIINAPLYLESGVTHNIMYLSSGIPLSLTLILCGAFHQKIEQYIFRGPLVPLMGLLASLCTFLMMGGFGEGLPLGLFVLLSAGTGVGTAFVCMRIGDMYSVLPGNRIFFTVFFSAVLSNLVFFMCAAISEIHALIVLSSLPLVATLLCLLRQEERPSHDSDMVPIEMLPRGFFARCVLVVLIFSVAVGIVKGMATLELPTGLRTESVISSVYFSFDVKIVLLVFFAVYSTMKKFDVGKVYYPIATAACLVVMATPFLGDTLRATEALLVDISYNIFILAIWCILTSISSQTTLSSVRVFGWGRGASALGNTMGQLVAGIFVAVIPELHEYAGMVAAILAVVILVSLQFVMSEKTVTEALEKTFREGVVLVAEGGSTNNGDGEEVSQEVPLSRWRALCETIAQEKGLTARESEILVYLSRGRTASYIAEELCISYNTAKGHIRNLYNKCDVHSRQELINLVESRIRR